MEVTVRSRPGGRPCSGGGALLMFAVEGASGPLGWEDAAGRALVVQAKEEGFSGKAGQAVLVHPREGDPASRVILAGLGPRDSIDNESFRRAAGRGAARAAAVAVRTLVMHVQGTGTRQAIRAVIEGAVLSQYRFLAYKTRPGEKERSVARIEVLPGNLPRREVEAGVAEGLRSARATALARDLGNEPSGELSPAGLAARARRLGGGVKVCVMGARQLAREGMGGLAGVGKGSRNPPVFIHLMYRGPSPRSKVALVGKGVCFDAGGISLKPSEGMHDMKGDMAGAAAVMAAMEAAGRMRLPLHIEGFIPAVENLPDGGALKPGDVVRILGGRTVEVQNTDAEGRLILADAISYALKGRPDHVIDVATLTGAAMVALGRGVAGLMGNDRALKDRLLEAGRVTGEPMWELPLVEDYREDLKSGIADLRNIGKKGEAGTIIGGLFLSEFAGRASWAHLDIAGVAWTERELPYCPPGSTGVPARALLEFLAVLAGARGGRRV